MNPFELFTNDDTTRLIWGDETANYHNYMNKNHKHILIKLAIEGPTSIGSLWKKLSVNNLEKALFLKIPDNLLHTLNDKQVYRSVVDLKNGGFIKELPIAPSRGEIGGITFQGLFWYFLYSAYDGINERVYEFFKKWENEGQIDHHFEPYYPMMLCSFWARLTKEVDRQTCLDILIASLHAFHVSGKQKIIAGSSGYKFEIFVSSIDHNESNYCINKVVFDFLRRENSFLKDSYFSYLLNQDIAELVKTKKKPTTDLKSLRELSRFENKQIKPCEIFNQDGLLRFFPSYSNLDSFFTGIFLNNLLWSIPPDPYDYQI